MTCPVYATVNLYTGKVTFPRPRLTGHPVSNVYLLRYIRERRQKGFTIDLFGPPERKTLSSFNLINLEYCMFFYGLRHCKFDQSFCKQNRKNNWQQNFNLCWTLYTLFYRIHLSFKIWITILRKLIYLNISHPINPNHNMYDLREFSLKF